MSQPDHRLQMQQMQYTMHAVPQQQHQQQTRPAQGARRSQMQQQPSQHQAQYQQPSQVPTQQQQQQPQQQQPQQQQQMVPQQHQQPQQQQQQQEQQPRPNFQMALQPPPQDRLYNTWDDLREDVKSFTRAQGYAMVVISSLNRDANGQYRRYNMCCSKGGKTYASHSRGLRTTRSTKTGCPMRLKAIQEKAYPFNDKWHVIVQCGEHNHEPFTGGSGAPVPAQFRKIENDGMRWLMIMQREAQCNLRQLTIGLRISFGDKYQYVKKSDVRNQLAKIKREEDRKAAAEAAALGLPADATYTILPQAHLPPPPPAPEQPIERMPQLPPDMQVPDPDLESDDDIDEM